MSKKPAILVIIMCCIFVNQSKSQDAEFSQFFNAPLYMNPAFAGVNEGPRFVVNYRNQWAALANAFITYAASYDQNFEGIGGGIGIIAVSDRQADGLLVSNSLSGIYSYQINLSRTFGLRAAGQVTFMQKKINADQLVFSDNLNPDNGSIIPGVSSDLPDITSKGIFDLAGGILFYTKKFYGGISAKHVTAPNESFISSQRTSIPLRMGINAGFEFHSKRSARTQSYFSPNALFVQQNSFKQLTIGAILGIGVVYGGLSYRSAFENGDAVILLMGLHKGIFKFGYSYDATISDLDKSSGTHELSLVLNLHDSQKVQSKRSTKRFTDCPNVF